MKRVLLRIFFVLMMLGGLACGWFGYERITRQTPDLPDTYTEQNENVHSGSDFVIEEETDDAWDSAYDEVKPSVPASDDVVEESEDMQA